MTHTKSSLTPKRLAGLSALLLATACSGGSGASGVTGNGFQLVSMSVQPGAIWEVNRPIDFVFSKPVDFTTISLNTISIRDLNGMPASGAFELLSDTTVRFQPTCPTLGDLSDSGLKIGGINYQIAVLGLSGGSGLSVEDRDGKALKDSQYRTFITPGSATPAVAFIDVQNGPPTPVVRQYATDGSVVNPGDSVTYIETAGGAGAPIEFEFDAATQSFNQPLDQGLNLYSDATTQLAVLVEFNQPVNPATDNIAEDRIYLEALDITGGPDNWVPISTDVKLEQNCSSTGATIRLEPQGILPQDSEVRVVVTTEFEDLVGDRNQLQVDNFAHFRVSAIDFPGLTPTDDGADEVKEDFVLAAADFGSLHDNQAAFAEPPALWDGGQLSAAFAFSGTGGSDGSFDWVVPSGDLVFLDSNGAVTINGGDIGDDMSGLGSFVVTKQQQVVGGQVNVRHLVIEDGATIRVSGANPVKIQASGNVLIRGTLDLSGFDRQDVATLNTGNQPEIGSAGSAGGGSGGTASFLTTTSTPQGGNGFGAFGQPNLGGGGGESGYGTGGKDKRRPGGGGGGSLGKDATGSTDLSGINFGTLREFGWDGGPTANGAITNLQPPQGGSPGPLPFKDPFDGNDFFGVAFDQGTGTVTVGELETPWAGSGGGAGGDAVPANSFPHPSWAAGTDEKGCGGGGASGSLHMLVLGNIIFEDDGILLAKGGKGGAGENTIGNDHLGGGGGGGSGGHVVLEAGSQLVFDGVSANCIDARGGNAGKGKSGTESINAGGSGGPGIIQIHVLDPASNIVFQNVPTTANSLAEVTLPDAIQLVPSFGALSKARSRWIAVGGASFNPGGGLDALDFFFGGVNPLTGSVLDVDNDDIVDLLPSILGPVTLVPSPGLPSIGIDGRTLTLDASALAGTDDDMYLRNPQLLRDATIVLRDAGQPSNAARFNVSSATSDTGGLTLALVVDGDPAPALSSFQPGGPIEALVHPSAFRVVTSDQADFLPDSVDVQFRFQSAPAGLDGLPDPGSTSAVDWTTDIADLNGVPAGDVDFIRFEVLFDLDAQGTGLTETSPRPALDFLRLMFRF